MKCPNKYPMFLAGTLKSLTYDKKCTQNRQNHKTKVLHIFYSLLEKGNLELFLLSAQLLARSKTKSYFNEDDIIQTLNLLIFNIQYPASNQTHTHKWMFPRKEGIKQTSRQNSSTGDQENNG